MNNNEPPPAPEPDPFERIAQQLATLAAGMVQLAGQIAALKPGATPPPPQEQQPEPQPEPPALEPEPTEEPEQKEPEASDEPQDEPEPAQDEPEAQEEGEDTPEEAPPAESPENGQDEEPAEEPKPENDEPTDSEAEGPKDETDKGEESDQESDQPAPEDLQESDQSGEGEELDEQPDTDAEEQESESEGTESEGTESESGEESEGEGEQSAPADDSKDDSGEGSNGEGESADNGDDDSAAEPAPGEGEADNDDSATDGSEEPEHVDYSDAMTAEGDGPHSENADEEGDATQPAANDGRGTAAALPPDLPPIDSTLANCSPPPAPEAVPYRELSPVARKCADLLTGALGKRFALARPDRHTGSLSAEAVARHAPDVFRRHPKRDGKRPKLCVIVDTSGSMGDVHRTHGQFLIDGLLEARRRRVIDLRLYDSHLTAYNMPPCAKQRGVNPDTGAFSEAAAKAIKDHAAQSALKTHGALCGRFGSEGFAAALTSLQPVILDSDATIIFTDGHWTDGALDKVKYQSAGMQIVGLYISLEIEQINGELAKIRAAVEADPTLAAPAAVLERAHNALQFAANASHSAQARYEKSELVYSAARTPENLQALKEATKNTNDTQNELSRLWSEYDTLANAWYSQPGASKTRAGMAARSAPFALRNHVAKRAASSVMLEQNSHRAYCTGNAIEAAQVIVQEISRQLESK